VHQSVALQELDGTEEHHLIVDEYPSPVQKIVLKEDLASGQRALSSILCTARKTECDGYVELTSNSYVKEISDDSAKSVSMFKESKNLRKVCRYIESPHWRVIVHEKEFNGLASFQDSQRSGEGKYFSLTVYVLMQPSVLANYASVTFMGANFTRSKLYLAWRSIVDFEPHPEIKKFRYKDFSHKEGKIKVVYLSEAPVSMKRLKDIGYESVIASIAGEVEAAYPSRPYIYTIYAGASDSVWPGANGTRLSANPMGLNDYLHYNMAVHAATLNPSNDHFAVWKAFYGVTREELMAAQAYEMQYQFATRTSIRDGKLASESEEVVLIVLDRRSADALCEVLSVDEPSFKLEVTAFSEYQAPPRKARSDKKPPKSREQVRAAAAERQRICRARKRGIVPDALHA